jgi:hypothetical protein
MTGMSAARTTAIRVRVCIGVFSGARESKIATSRNAGKNARHARDRFSRSARVYDA